MSKLSKFLGVTIPIDIRGEMLKLYPLTVKEMGILERLKELTEKGEKAIQEEKDEMAKLSKDLVKISFKEENFTDAEIDGMDIELYAEVYSAIMDNIINSTQNGKGFDKIRRLKEQAVQQGTK